jgi:type VI secretion system protein VasD
MTLRMDDLHTTSRWKNYLCLLLIVCTTPFFSGCMHMPMATQESTRLVITLDAVKNLNPDRKGRAAPIQVRIYELQSVAAFQEADYFSLQANDTKVLGPELLAKDVVLLQPGAHHVINRLTSANTRAIGVIAGYRNMSGAIWKKILLLPVANEPAWYRFFLPSQPNEFAIVLDKNAIKLSPEPSRSTH